jgi:hypothetical protein
MSSLRISNIELMLMQAIAESKFKTGNQDFIWLSSVEKAMGGKRAVSKAKDSALASGLIEFDSTVVDDDYGVRLTSFASRLMTAIKKY